MSREILIGHAGGCRRPDPARYVHHYGFAVTLAGASHMVSVDMCPGCDQYVVCRGKCWDERRMSNLAHRHLQAERERIAAQNAAEEARANRMMAVATLACLLVAAAVLLTYAGGR